MELKIQDLKLCPKIVYFQDLLHYIHTLNTFIGVLYIYLEL